MKPASPEVTAATLRRLTKTRPRLAIILGTGFHSCLESLEGESRIPYSRLPGMPNTGVSGHRGELVVGTLGGGPVVVLRGRAHFYEGHSMVEVTFGVRSLAAFGIQALLLTNAAGGINPKLRVGDFMVIEDHINFMGVNPLRGVRAPDSSRFVDLSQVYDPGLSALLFRAGKACGLRLKKGVYLAVSGPSYETPAESKAFRRWGADAVGMSTAPEAVVARQCGLRVCGVSCITNLAAGRANRQLDHSEVLATGDRARERADHFLRQFATLFSGVPKVSG